MGQVTSVRIAEDLVDGLEALAKEKVRSKGWVLNQALREYLHREALEKQRWVETEAALAEVERGEVVGSEDVHRWMDSWGSDAELPKPKPRHR